MGFKATEWAYSLDIAPATKAVLLALAHRADDKTFECFPGQQALASMTGASLRTVSRALNELEAEGVITRKQRRRPGGSRTSDLCIINRSYTSESHLTESHVTESHETESPRSPDTESKVTGQSDRYIEEEQSGEQPEDHSDSRDPLESEFEQFWKVYPRRQAKADALRAYKVARKDTDSETILAGTQRYALLTHGKEREYLKLPAGWLRGRRWEDDEIPQTASASKAARNAAEYRRIYGAKDERARQTLAIGQELTHRDPNAWMARREIPAWKRPPEERGNAPTECPFHPGYVVTPTAPCERCKRDRDNPEPELEFEARPLVDADLDPLGGNPF